MYNSIKLYEQNYCLQRYIWQQDLDLTKIPEEKVIKTLMYGAKSSGNQAKRALRETAKLSQVEYLKVNEIVKNDIYVDDCISGEQHEREALKRADELEVVLNRGGVILKGITFLNQDPTESLSDDDESINVAGNGSRKMTSFHWTLKMNFAKKIRGRKSTTTNNIIPSKLTRRDCVSKVCEIFDIIGKLTPLTAAMKLDLHELVPQKLDWDDKIPDNLPPIWESHFQMVNEIKTLKYQMAVIPEDAIDIQLETLDFGDANREIACIAIYARFRRKDDTYSCQLVFARSRLFLTTRTQPRADL